MGCAGGSETAMKELQGRSRVLELTRASKRARNIAFELPYLPDEALMAVYMTLGRDASGRVEKGL